MCFNHTDELRKMFKAKYGQTGTSDHQKETSTYMIFSECVFSGLVMMIGSVSSMAHIDAVG